MPALRAALEGVDFADVCITSGIEIVAGEPPEGAFTLPETPGVGVVSRRAQGRKCARSWRISPLVGDRPRIPRRDPARRQALRELRAAGFGRELSRRESAAATGFGTWPPPFWCCALDQASKVLGDRPARRAGHPVIPLTPFLALTMSWNRGVAYTMLRSDSDFGRYRAGRPGADRGLFLGGLALAGAGPRRRTAGLGLPDRRRARQCARPAHPWRGRGFPLFPHAFFARAAVQLRLQCGRRRHICRRHASAI